MTVMRSGRLRRWLGGIPGLIMVGKAYRCVSEETVKIRESLQFTKVYSPAKKASSQVMRSAKKVST